jgi:hypothetical protein
MILVVTDDQQLQQSGLGFFANAQNTHITDSSFIVVSLCFRCVRDFSTNLWTEQFQYSPC